MTTTTKARYQSPGSFFPEESVKAIPSGTIEEAIKLAPESAFCFTLYEIAADVPDLGPDFAVTPKAQHESGRFYLGGRLYTAAELEGKPNMDILVSNMRGNGWDRVIQTRRGNWQPFTDADEIVVPACPRFP